MAEAAVANNGRAARDAAHRRQMATLINDSPQNEPVRQNALLMVQGINAAPEAARTALYEAIFKSILEYPIANDPNLRSAHYKKLLLIIGKFIVKHGLYDMFLAPVPANINLANIPNDQMVNLAAIVTGIAAKKRLNANNRNAEAVGPEYFDEFNEIYDLDPAMAAQMFPRCERRIKNGVSRGAKTAAEGEAMATACGVKEAYDALAATVAAENNNAVNECIYPFIAAYMLDKLSDPKVKKYLRAFQVKPGRVVTNLLIRDLRELGWPVCPVGGLYGHPFNLTGLKADVCLNIFGPTSGKASVLTLLKIKDIVAAINAQYTYEVNSGSWNLATTDRDAGSTAMWLVTQLQMNFTCMYFMKNLTGANNNAVTFNLDNTAPADAPVTPYQTRAGSNAADANTTLRQVVGAVARGGEFPNLNW